MEVNQNFGNMHAGEKATDVWLTPPEIIQALGSFDLDPCSPIDRPWDTARKHYTIVDDGLAQIWNRSERCWMNPPYGTETHKWMAKLANHGNGIALIFARTETKAFFPYVWDKADAVFFFNKRINFYDVTGKQAKTNAGAPSCLVAYGKANVLAIRNSGLGGKLVMLRD